MSTLQRLKRWLDRHPRLRRRIVNAIFHIPALDVRLRGALSQQYHGAAALDVDAEHLGEQARQVRHRLQSRIHRA